MSTSHAPRRSLRVGLLLAGKLREERTIHPPDRVTIGASSKNTFCVPLPGLPRSFALFTSSPSGYALHLLPGMDARLSSTGAPADADDSRPPSAGPLPLTDSTRGRLVLGELTLLFQFVHAPAQPRLRLPPSIQGRLLDRIDPLMAGILFFSLVAHGAGVGLVYAMDTPRPLLPDEASDHYVVKRIPRAMPLPLPKPQTGSAQGAATPTPTPSPSPGPSPSPSHTPAPFDPGLADREKAMAAGVISIIGSAGKKPGGPFDTTNGKNLGDGLSEGLRKAREQGVTASLDPRPGTTSHTPQTIGGGNGPQVTGPADTGRTPGPRTGELDIKTSTDIGRPVVDDDGGLSAEDVYSKIKLSYAGPLQKCYQDALKSNSALKGRVDVVFTIGAGGSVTRVEVDGFDSGVDACIQENARRWRFAKPPGGAATFQFPFTFRAGH